MSAGAAIILAENITRSYPVGSRQVLALRGINLEVPAGQFWALKGRSGSGKTTLLNCLGGLDTPTSGRVFVLGQEISAMNDRQRTAWRRDHLGLVFQSFSLLPTLSAYENVELVLRIRSGGGRVPHPRPLSQRERGGEGVKTTFLSQGEMGGEGVDVRSPGARRERALETLKMVGLERWKGHRPNEMSGGQQQRVAIARALANQAPIILADEPTGELDSNTSREILGLFRSLVKEHGITLVMVSHDPIVDEYADKILHLSDGKILEE